MVSFVYGNTKLANPTITKDFIWSLLTPMIDLENQTVRVLDKTEKIIRWGVVFVTIEGQFETVDEALASCEKTLQPPHTIVPLPVAYTENYFEVSLTQGAIFEKPDSSDLSEFPDTE